MKCFPETFIRFPGQNFWNQAMSASADTAAAFELNILTSWLEQEVGAFTDLQARQMWDCWYLVCAAMIHLKAQENMLQVTLTFPP